MKYFEQLDIHSLTFNGFSQPHLDLTITLLSFIQVVWFMIYHLQYLCNGRSDSPSGGVTSLATVLRKGRRTVLRIRAENSSPPYCRERSPPYCGEFPKTHVVHSQDAGSLVGMRMRNCLCSTWQPRCQIPSLHCSSGAQCHGWASTGCHCPDYWSRIKLLNKTLLGIFSLFGSKQTWKQKPDEKKSNSTFNQKLIY